MKSLLRWITSLLATAATASALAQAPAAPAAPAAAGEEDIKFALDFIPLGRHAPWYVALAKGYFKEEKLNVTILPSSTFSPLA